MYGIDLEQPGLLQERSWRWLRNRILGLLSKPPTVTPDRRVISSTRLGLALFPPKPPDAGV